MQPKSSKNIGQTSPGSGTFENAEPTTSRQLTLLPEDFLAKMSASPAPERELPGQGRDSGRNSPELFASFDPVSSSWRTSQACLVEGWERYSETWPASGLMLNGKAFRRVPLVPLIDVIGSSSLPSLCASEAEKGGMNQSDSKGAAKRYSITALMRRGLMPTLTVSGNWNRKGSSKKSGDGLSTVLGGTPNPAWLDWYQGFPVGWTDIAGDDVKSESEG